MAALSITVGNVGIGTDSVDVRAVQVGEAVTQGAPGRISANKYYLCNNSTTTDAAATCIFMGPASADGDYVLALFSGRWKVGATVTVGQTYVVGNNDGELAPISDLTTGDYVTILGIADTSSTIVLDINASGVVKP